MKPTDMTQDIQTKIEPTEMTQDILQKVEYQKPTIQKVVIERDKTLVLGGCGGSGWKS